jgi:hypothetical protein
MHGDDENQIGAFSALSIPRLNNSFPVFILGWTIGGLFHQNGCRRICEKLCRIVIELTETYKYINSRLKL